MRMCRTVLIAGMAAATAGALTLSVGSAATTTAATTRAVPHAASHASAQYLAKARTSLIRYLRSSRPLIARVQPGNPDLPAGASTQSASYNWSGYADATTTAGTFSQVSGRWRMPAVACTREQTLAAQWVGLDGFNNTTVEQDGTLAYCFEGTATYYTWWEMYPAVAIEAVGETVQPGDVISASVKRSGTSYQLSVTDYTHQANSFSATQICAASTCLDTSAEWIQERPAFSIGIAPLADYFSWLLTGATETANGRTGTISSFAPNYSVNMVDATDTYQLSAPSPLFARGAAFSTRWLNSY
jgi:hypothetical protein